MPLVVRKRRKRVPESGLVGGVSGLASRERGVGAGAEGGVWDDVSIGTSAGGGARVAVAGAGRPPRVRAGVGIALLLLAALAALPVQAQNRPATGVGIAGAGRIGQTLTADTSAMSDADGLAGVSYSYQWFHLDGVTETPIPGATSPTYMPVTSDFGRRVRVRVSFTDNRGFPETPASAAVTIRAAMPPAACPAFTVPAGRERVWTGTLTVGEVVSGSTVAGHGFSGDSGGLGDPKHFELTATRYTVDEAYAGADSATLPGALRLSLDGALTAVQAANLRLHVCGESWAFADAAFEAATHSYVWPGAGLDWSGSRA